MEKGEEKPSISEEDKINNIHLFGNSPLYLQMIAQ